MSATGNAKLTLDDIADLRAYERERAEFRSQVIELKKRRRLHRRPAHHRSSSRTATRSASRSRRWPGSRS